MHCPSPSSTPVETMWNRVKKDVKNTRVVGVLFENDGEYNILRKRVVQWVKILH